MKLVFIYWKLNTYLLRKSKRVVFLKNIYIFFENVLFYEEVIEDSIQ